MDTSEIARPTLHVIPIALIDTPNTIESWKHNYATAIERMQDSTLSVTKQQLHASAVSS